MEENGEAPVVTHVCKEENVSGRTVSEEEYQASNATGDVSSQSTGPGDESQRSDESKKPRWNRLELFNKVMEMSLQKFIDHASFHRFANAFHPFVKKNPQVTENIHQQFIQDLQRTIEEDINKVIVEGQLQCKLDELDELEKKAKKCTDKKKAKECTDPAWRPSGIPEQDLCSFVMPSYKKQEAYLKKELKKIREQNAALAQRVQAGREDIVQTEQRITAAVDEWKASTSQFQTLASSFCPPDTIDV